MSTSSDDSMKAILATRFDPFNFADIPRFPNVVTTINEWGECIP